MDTSNSHDLPYQWVADPDSEVDQDGRVPQRSYNGWIRITRPWNGHRTVVKVEIVRFVGRLYMERLYPPRPAGYPFFLYGLPGGDIECITEEEALAWLKQHNLPLPEPQVQDDARPDGEGAHLDSWQARRIFPEAQEEQAP